MTAPRVALPTGTVVAAAVAVVALSAASTVGLAAASNGFSHRTHPVTCSAVPSLPGPVIAVTVNDLRSMMGGGSMMTGGRSMMGQSDWPRFRHGMMTVTASPRTAPAGAVSLVVRNAGYLTHELVVLPLAAGTPVGTRTVGTDGTVDETGSLAEASASCASGTGDGIAAGSTGWTTVRLAAGRYELLCNLPGHYTGGMYAELDVS